MASKYKVTYSGMDGRMVKSFSTLAAVQEYVKGRWEGADYIDGLSTFHNDYGRYTLTGCTLSDLGQRNGEYGTDEYWDWTWKQV